MLTSIDLSQDNGFLLYLVKDQLSMVLILLILALFVGAFLRKLPYKQLLKDSPLFTWICVVFFFILSLQMFGYSKKATTDDLSKLASAESTIVQIKAGIEVLDEKTRIDTDKANEWIKESRKGIANGLSKNDYYTLVEKYNNLNIGYVEMTNWFAENPPEKIEKQWVDQLTVAKTQQVQEEQMKLQAQNQANGQSQDTVSQSESEITKVFGDLLESDKKAK